MLPKERSHNVNFLFGEWPVETHFDAPLVLGHQDKSSRDVVGLSLSLST